MHGSASVPVAVVALDGYDESTATLLEAALARIGFAVSLALGASLR